uniref:Uncharacterized protein n=1 Tax=Oryza brachyantha TaxID=4533 RepID=J3LG26_ORYBR
MHRQLSLSPGPKQQLQQQQEHDGVGVGGGGSDAAGGVAVPEESTAAKAGGRLVREERTIHLIPLLTFLCFLLLFLFSHDPSSSDMSSFSDAGRTGNRRLRML